MNWRCWLGLHELPDPYDKEVPPEVACVSCGLRFSREVTFNKSWWRKPKGGPPKMRPKPIGLPIQVPGSPIWSPIRNMGRRKSSISLELRDVGGIDVFCFVDSASTDDVRRLKDALRNFSLCTCPCYRPEPLPFEAPPKRPVVSERLRKGGVGHNPEPATDRPPARKRSLLGPEIVRKDGVSFNRETGEFLGEVFPPSSDGFAERASPEGDEGPEPAPREIIRKGGIGEKPEGLPMKDPNEARSGAEPPRNACKRPDHFARCTCNEQAAIHVEEPEPATQTASNPTGEEVGFGQATKDTASLDAMKAVEQVSSWLANALDRLKAVRIELHAAIEQRDGLFRARDALRAKNKQHDSGLYTPSDTIPAEPVRRLCEELEGFRIVCHSSTPIYFTGSETARVGKILAEVKALLEETTPESATKSDKRSLLGDGRLYMRTGIGEEWLVAEDADADPVEWYMVTDEETLRALNASE